MSTKRIGDLPFEQPCTDPGHRPPSQIVLEPGVYEHTCPGCGQSFTFVVPPGPRWFVDKLPARRNGIMGSTRKEKTIIVTPTGAWFECFEQDKALAEWACDILNAGEIK